MKTYINTILAYGGASIDEKINEYCKDNNVEIVQVVDISRGINISTAKVVFRKP